MVYPQHRLAGRSSIPVDELNDENFVAFTSELIIRKKIDRWLKQSKVSVNVVHEFDNRFMVLIAMFGVMIGMIVGLSMIAGLIATLFGVEMPNA